MRHLRSTEQATPLSSGSQGPVRLLQQDDIATTKGSPQFSMLRCCPLRVRRQRPAHIPSCKSEFHWQHPGASWHPPACQHSQAHAAAANQPPHTGNSQPGPAKALPPIGSGSAPRALASTHGGQREQPASTESGGRGGEPPAGGAPGLPKESPCVRPICHGGRLRPLCHQPVAPPPRPRLLGQPANRAGSGGSTPRHQR